MKYDKMGEDSGLIGSLAGVGATNAYVVTEKVHGANFCIIASYEHGSTNAPTIRFAKRTAILGSANDADDFYSCRSSGLLRILAPRAEAVLSRLSADIGNGENLEAVHIYGELFGGSYPHPDVPRCQGIEAVQQGIWYAPDLRFMAFDVACETAVAREFLRYDLARQVCEESDLLFAAPLFKGTLAECLDFPIEYETTIPARLGLPPLPSCNNSSERNLAEGVVVRPVQEPLARRANGLRAGKESVRGLFKRKIAAFSEKRYQNDDWKNSKAGGGGAATANDEELAGLEIAACVTEQRLANVLSKTGRVDPKDKDACRSLLEDFQQDVRDALEEGDLQMLLASSSLQAELESMCKAVIKRELMRDYKKKRCQQNATGGA
jgi:Rnl2 family RNA ligase